MEANRSKKVETRVPSEETTSVIEGYVSPEVAAAQAGEQVDFGKDLGDEDENDTNA